MVVYTIPTTENSYKYSRTYVEEPEDRDIVQKEIMRNSKDFGDEEEQDRI